MSSKAPAGFFTFELATLFHDIAKASAVVNAAYKKVGYLREDVDRITIPELLGSLSNPKHKLYLCLSEAGEICGTILLDFFEDHAAEIALFAIHPAYQGCQIGPRFMEHVEREAFQQVSTIILKVIPLFQEKLIQFYERLGYTVTGKTIDFPEEAKARCIRDAYRDQMFFSIMEKKHL